MEYITVRKEADDFFVEKKSRFIGYCKPVQTEQEALDYITEIKKKNWDATHNVHAYILREGGVMRYSDDGEPQGTAGIPVLEAMRKGGVVDAVVIATRYFGGTMLGAGGLVRAYSHTASIALAAAEKIRMKECEMLELTCDYTEYGKLSNVLPEAGAMIDDVEFLENVRMSFHIFPEQREEIDKLLADTTNGKVIAKGEETMFFEVPLEE